MNLQDPNEDDTREISESEEIARRAYALWERSGCTHDHSLADWLEAERQFRGIGNASDDPASPGLLARESMPNESVEPEGWVRVPAIEERTGRQR